MISITASMPSMTGIIMSMITRSGFSRRRLGHGLPAIGDFGDNLDPGVAGQKITQHHTDQDGIISNQNANHNGISSTDQGFNCFQQGPLIEGSLDDIGLGTGLHAAAPVFSRRPGRRR